MLIPDKATLDNIEREPFTWAKLKEFCNGLTEEQLTQEVIVPQDESSITILYASELGEDQYHFVDDEYTCTKEEHDLDLIADGKYSTLQEAFEKEDAVLIPGSSVYLFDE